MERDRIEEAEILKRICHDAFHKYPDSCSHAVWHVIRHYVPSQHFMAANDLITFLSTNPQWQEVGIDEISGLAGEGIVVVGGVKQEGHGHVIVVFPGPEKGNGGYPYQDKKTGEFRNSRMTGIYPLALSTTMGTWPGAKSDGDKTVRDPWAPAEFKLVKFWKYLGKDKARIHVQSQSSQRWEPEAALRVGQSTSTSSLRWQLDKDTYSMGQETPGSPIRWQR